MKNTSIFGCIVTGIIGLVVMSLCSLIFIPTWSALASLVVFICFSGIITATILRENSGHRAKISALCIFIGLVGIVVMQLCNMLVAPPFSGIAGFVVFLCFAAVIVVILANQKKYFVSEYKDFLRDHSKRDAAFRLIHIFRGKGVVDREIKNIIMDKFSLDAATTDELLNSTKY